MPAAVGATGPELEPPARSGATGAGAGAGAAAADGATAAAGVGVGVAAGVGATGAGPPLAGLAAAGATGPREGLAALGFWLLAGLPVDRVACAGAGARSGAGKASAEG